MAEPTPSTSTPNSPESSDPRPKLVAVDPAASGGEAAPERAPAGSRSERSGGLVVWLLLALLVLAAGGIWLQSQRLGQLGQQNLALGEEIQALEVQLSAANLQIQSYQMQQELVRGVTADIARRVGELQALVEGAPLAPQDLETP